MLAVFGPVQKPFFVHPNISCEVSFNILSRIVPWFNLFLYSVYLFVGYHIAYVGLVFLKKDSVVPLSLCSNVSSCIIKAPGVSVSPKS